MRKTSSVLSFLLAAGLLLSFCIMSSNDATNAAENTREAFEELHSRNIAAFEDDNRAAESRRSEEKVYGLLGAVFVIAGFATWPYSPTFQS